MEAEASADACSAEATLMAVAALHPTGPSERLRVEVGRLARELCADARVWLSRLAELARWGERDTGRGRSAYEHD